MNWQAIGALGELLGGFVVLASLVFLAIQIRRATQALEVTAADEANRSFAAYTAMFTQPGISRVYRVGLASPTELTDDELITFNAVISTFMNYQAHSHGLRARGIFHAWSNEKGDKASASYVVRQPGGREWWYRFRATYSEDFQSFIDSSLEADRSG
jgi:hypothetical protein